MREALDNSKADRRRQRAAMAAALWVALVYATIPLVRVFQRWFLARYDIGWIMVGLLAVMAAILGITGLWLVRSTRRPSPLDLLVTVAVAIIAVWWAWELRSIPEEAIHLLEYGILMVLVYRAMRPAEPDLGILIAAVLLTTLMSTVDEIIQWITPKRFWDYGDIAINGGAAALAAVAVWRLDSGPWRRPPASSIRLVLRLAVALLVLFTLCLANTPDPVARYVSRVPFLDFLSQRNEMAEYGHLHVIPAIGAFKSRLQQAELVEEDRRRGTEVATIIDQYPGKDYWKFVKEHLGFRDPLLYESRVHIFSRNRHIRQARESAPGSPSERFHLTVAYRENQVLERFFRTTLHHSVFSLPESMSATLETAHDPDQAFVSKTGSHLITRFSEPALRSILLSLAVLFIVLDIIIGVLDRRLTEASE